MHDLRHAIRALRRAPGFALVAVLTLGLGIGASVAMFTVVNGVLISSLPFPHADRLVDFTSVPPESRDRQMARGWWGATSPYAALDVWQHASDVMDDGAAMLYWRPVWMGPKGAEHLNAEVVTADFFPVLGVQPALGRLLDSADARMGAPATAVLSHSLWRSRFGGDSTIVGRAVTLDTTVYTVVGVAPAGFAYLPGVQAWTSFGGFFADLHHRMWLQAEGWHVVGRLKAGVTLSKARASFDRVTRAANAMNLFDRPLLPIVVPLRTIYAGPVHRPIRMMAAAAILLFLIACANVAGLLFARGLAQRHATAVRRAVGASALRILRRPLFEALLLGLGGAGLGVYLALWGVPALRALAGNALSPLFALHVDAASLAAAAAFAVLAGVVTGVGPALRLLTVAPARVLVGRQATESRGRRRGSDIAMAGQMAGTVVLLAVVGVLGRSFLKLINVPLGFATDHVVVADVRLPGYRHAYPGGRTAVVDEIARRLAATPGVGRGTVATGIPMDGGIVTTDVTRPDRPNAKPTGEAWVAGVTPGYFGALGIPLLRGRDPFTADKGDDLVIDVAAARAYFPGQDPLGRQLSLFGGHIQGTVAGVVGNIRQRSPAEPPSPHIYHAYARDPETFLRVIARGNVGDQALARAITQAVHGADPMLPIDDIGPLADKVGATLSRTRFYVVIIGLFGLTALLLAAVGLYGATALAAERRTREVGVRMALGAGRRRVVTLIERGALVPTVAGIAVGLGAASLVLGALKGFTYQLGTRDPTSLVGAAGVLVLVAVGAAYLPARRASRANPVEVLREE